MNVVEASNLTHRYGRVTALRDVNLTIPEGVVYALLGPNGAGKTTLLHLLSGLDNPTSGRVSVLGKEPRHWTVEDRARIGYVAEGQRLPEWASSTSRRRRRSQSHRSTQEPPRVRPAVASSTKV